jgi:hypothetical protein
MRYRADIIKRLRYVRVYTILKSTKPQSNPISRAFEKVFTKLFVKKEKRG